jgi:hypothetical protein
MNRSPRYGVFEMVNQSLGLGYAERSVPNMPSHSIRFDMLFDADEYHRTVNWPWTFFSYPTSLADGHGLPPDREACELLALVQQRGIDVAIWVSQIVENTTYFACRIDDRQKLGDVLNELQSSGTIDANFCSIRSERLFARCAEGTEQKIAAKCSIDRLDLR